MRRLKNSWFPWLVFIIIALVFFGLWKASEGIELQRKDLTGKFAIERVDLMFNSRIPAREVWVSEDMKQYIGWVFINQDIGACHIAKTFQGFRRCLQVRGDPWTRKPRKIVATIISEDCLKEYFGLEWREGQ